ncbi:MAG: terminase small subunit [Clostridia bacterium]
MDNEVKDINYNNLTVKQQKFIDFYIEKGNATEAAELAGYSKKTAKQIGSENLSKLDDYIKVRLKQLEDKRIATADEVLKYFTSVMRGEEKDSFGLDASLRDRNDAAKCLAQRFGILNPERENKTDMELSIKVDYGDDDK